MKKQTTLNGRVQMPLQVGGRATIAYNGQTLRTSTVVAILEVSDSRIVIETQNTVYSVLPDATGRVLETPGYMETAMAV